MSPDAELFLEPSRTRAVSDIDVASGKNKEPNVTLNPRDSTITVGGGEPETGGHVRLKDSSNTVTAADLSANNGSGNLLLRDRQGEKSVAVDGSDSSSNVEVFQGGTATSRIETDTRGGKVSVRDAIRDQSVVVAEADLSKGRVAVKDSQGRTTCELLGDDGALLLSGPPELPTNSDLTSSEAGGGELLVQKWAKNTNDIHVHATAESESQYGAEQSNPARIFLDGPNATLDMGRRKLGTDRPAENGEIIVRDDNGDALLELRATTSGTSEILFRWSDDGTPKLRGKIRGEKDGLAIYDSAGNKAMLITKRGTVKTRKKIKNNL
jgi:hypothetical protein